MKRLTLYLLACVTVCLFIGLPVFAAECTGCHQDGLSLNSGNQTIDETLNTLTCEMNTAPAIVAASNTNVNDENCDQANIAQSKEAAIQATNEKIDGQHFMTLTATSPGIVLKTEVQSGVLSQGDDATIMASWTAGCNRCMIAGASSIDKAQGRFATQARSGHGIV